MERHTYASHASTFVNTKVSCFFVNRHVLFVFVGDSLWVDILFNPRTCDDPRRVRDESVPCRKTKLGF